MNVFDNILCTWKIWRVFFEGLLDIAGNDGDCAERGGKLVRGSSGEGAEGFEGADGDEQAVDQRLVLGVAGGGGLGLPFLLHLGEVGHTD